MQTKIDRKFCTNLPFRIISPSQLWASGRYCSLVREKHDVPVFLRYFDKKSAICIKNCIPSHCAAATASVAQPVAMWNQKNNNPSYGKPMQVLF